MIDLRDNIEKDLTLSMGMSNDYEIALSLKSDIVELVQEYSNEKILNFFCLQFQIFLRRLRLNAILKRFMVTEKFNKDFFFEKSKI